LPPRSLMLRRGFLHNVRSNASPEFLKFSTINTLEGC
jgi:hypothetical protein